MKIEKLAYDDHTILLYRNDDENICHRKLVLDIDNHIIQDELSEYDKQGKHLANVIFAPDYITVIGKRVFTDNVFTDYRLIDGKLQLTQYAVNTWLIPNQKAKCEWFNANGELVYYDIFEKMDDEIGMVITGKFDKNDVSLWGLDSPPMIEFPQSYSDY